MAGYKRKTVDVWKMYVDYGQGWEYELSEYSREAIKRRRNEYAKNCPQYPVKIVAGREKIKGRSDEAGKRSICECVLR